MSKTRFAFGLIGLSLLFASGATLDTPKFAVLQRITVGGDGGWDYVTYDADSHRVYASHGTHVAVVDVDAGKVIGDIPNTNGVHGVAIDHKANKGFTSNGRDNTVTVFDLKTLKETGRITVGTGPDAIFYDAASDRVFTFNGRSSDATAIDPNTDKVIGTVPLGGKPEACASDGKNKIYVNIEDKSQVVEFDSKTLKVLNTWSLAPGEEPTGMGMDLKNHLIYSSCANNKMTVLDFKTGKVIASPKIGNGPDGAGFDPGEGLAFSSNGADGTLSVIQRQRDGTFKELADVPTQVSARTMTVDPKSHRIFLLAAEPDMSAPANGRRRPMKPNSFMVVVVGPAK